MAPQLQPHDTAARAFGLRPLAEGIAADIEAAYERTAKALLDQKIISKEPSGAYTTAITDKAIQ